LENFDDGDDGMVYEQQRLTTVPGGQKDKAGLDATFRILPKGDRLHRKRAVLMSPKN